MAPAAWVRKLVTLCDQAPATPLDAIRLVLEKELGKSIDQVFETFDDKPLGSASIAQVLHSSIAHSLTAYGEYTTVHAYKTRLRLWLINIYFKQFYS